MANYSPPPLPPHKGPGRPPGALNKATVRSKAFANKILDSPEFEAYVMDGITSRKIPPLVLTTLMHYGWGKPLDRSKIEVSVTEGSLSDLSVADLAARARTLADKLAEPDADVVH